MLGKIKIKSTNEKKTDLRWIMGWLLGEKVKILKVEEFRKRHNSEPKEK